MKKTIDELKAMGKMELVHMVYNLQLNEAYHREYKTKFLKIVKNITSKGFVRSNYEDKLVDLSDIRINLKSKN